MKGTSGYPIVTWAEVQKNNSDAYERFKFMAHVWIANNELRPIFQALLPIKRKLPQVESVMSLFVVRAKRNWRWVGVRLCDEGISVLLAAGMKGVIPFSSESNAHTRWWH